jgi:hypothetical protein
LEFGFDPAQVSAVSDVAHSNLVRAMLIIGAIAAVGLLGRVFFGNMRDWATRHNPLGDASGAGLIIGALVLIFGGLYFTSGHVKSMVVVQRHIVDPFVVSVLKKDSCALESGDYCVVVFEQDREIVVNWFDKRVHMLSLMTPPMNPPWGSPRPKARAQHLIMAAASEAPGAGVTNIVD